MRSVMTRVVVEQDRAVIFDGPATREGAVGVGRATTEAVVNASLAVLISNFFLTRLLLFIFP